jgi:flagellar biosynthesis/type III secretory pathway chaperone
MDSRNPVRKSDPVIGPRNQTINQTTDRHAWLKRLTQVLAEQVATATDLIDAPEEEEEKRPEQWVRFEELERERRLLCQTGGVGPQRSAMETLLDELAASVNPLYPEIQTHWQQLTGLIRRCWVANETNGLISQTRHRQLLQLLGLARLGGADLIYGSRGATPSAGAQSRALAHV